MFFKERTDDDYFLCLKGDTDPKRHLAFTLPLEAFILPTLNIFEIAG